MRPRRLAIPMILASILLAALPVYAPAWAVGPIGDAPDDRVGLDRGWFWPVEQPFRIVAPFSAPAHAYAPGHRGIDVEPETPAVRAPADGVVAFVGRVVDRELITIDHGDGLVSTLEPVAPAVAVGDPVRRGDLVGEIGLGGHTRPGSLHLGLRLDGEYINPLLLLGGVPRAVLLPCCD